MSQQSENQPATAKPPLVVKSDGSAVMQAAPGAVRHSMPMALSIMLGILGAAVTAWFFTNLLWLIMLLYIAFVIASILEAPVQSLRKFSLPRGLATAVVLGSCVALVGGVIALFSGEMIKQSHMIVEKTKYWPGAIQKFITDLAARVGATDQLKELEIGKMLADALPAWGSIFNNALGGVSIITSAILLFCMVLYMLLEGPEVLLGLSNLLPTTTRLEATDLFTKMTGTHRRWFLATSINMFSSAVLSMIGLSILGIPGALVLGGITGFGELVPNIGPIIVVLPSLLMTLVAAPDKIWMVILMFVAVQAIQGYGISPLVMKMGVRLPVLALVVAVLAMGTLFGPLGILVAIPLTADLIVIWHYFNQIVAKRSTPPTVKLPDTTP